jgi:hypothetical protein
MGDQYDRKRGRRRWRKGRRARERRRVRRVVVVRPTDARDGLRAMDASARQAERWQVAAKGAPTGHVPSLRRGVGEQVG